MVFTVAECIFSSVFRSTLLSSWGDEELVKLFRVPGVEAEAVDVDFLWLPFVLDALLSFTSSEWRRCLWRADDLSFFFFDVPRLPFLLFFDDLALSLHGRPRPRLTLSLYNYFACTSIKRLQISFFFTNKSDCLLLSFSFHSQSRLERPHSAMCSRWPNPATMDRKMSSMNRTMSCWTKARMSNVTTSTEKTYSTWESVLCHTCFLRP